MKCIVTCGPTYEPLDKVRRLTNFSTGTLGVQLANHLTNLGHEVHLLKGYYCTTEQKPVTQNVHIFTTTDDLAQKLEAKAADSFDAVFHAAAVSDFGFGKVYGAGNDGELVPLTSGKFSTTGQRLLVELAPTRKILPSLRKWFGPALIVGWKYEVDGDQQSAIQKGYDQLATCATDASIVNGPAYGQGFGLVRPEKLTHCPNHSVLYEHLAELVANRPNR